MLFRPENTKFILLYGTEGSDSGCAGAVLHNTAPSNYTYHAPTYYSHKYDTVTTPQNWSIIIEQPHPTLR